MFEIYNIKPRDVAEVDRMVGFLAENVDPGIRPRPRDELDLAVDKGLGLRIEQNSKICGCSLIYYYDDGDTGERNSEIGTMRIIANGYGLQVFLAYFHILQIVLEQFRTKGSIFAVVKPGSRSELNLIDIGLTPWSPPENLRFIRQISGVPFLPDKAVLAVSRKAAIAAFEALRELHVEDNIFKTPRGDGLVRVNMQWFSAEILEMVEVSDFDHLPDFPD